MHRAQEAGELTNWHFIGSEYLCYDEVQQWETKVKVTDNLFLLKVKRYFKPET